MIRVINFNRKKSIKILLWVVWEEALASRKIWPLVNVSKSKKLKSKLKRRMLTMQAQAIKVIILCKYFILWVMDNKNNKFLKELMTAVKESIWMINSSQWEKLKMNMIVALSMIRVKKRTTNLKPTLLETKHSMVLAK